MTFKIKKINYNQDTRTDVVTGIVSRQEAYTQALDLMTAFIMAHWSAAPGDGDSAGPTNRGKFKIYVDRRPKRFGLRPAFNEIELRYDYPVDGEQETNSIFWRIIEE